MMDDEFSPEKKRRIIEFAKWLNSLVPNLPKTATIREVWDELTPTQRRRVTKQLAEIYTMD